MKPDQDAAPNMITAPSACSMPLVAAADLQDNMLAVNSDLERLQSLMDDCHAAIESGFFGLLEMLPGGAEAPAAQAHVANAIKALQFQDMATQLIAHTRKRLRNSADRLASQAFGGSDEDGSTVVEQLPERPNPVTQSAMETGFVELF